MTTTSTSTTHTPGGQPPGPTGRGKSPSPDSPILVLKSKQTRMTTATHSATREFQGGAVTKNGPNLVQTMGSTSALNVNLTDYDAAMQTFKVPFRGSVLQANDRISRTRPLTLAAWALVSRYALFVDTFTSAGQRVGGLASQPGDDLIIANTRGRFDDQGAAVVMHELGHSLGLAHGGAEEVNCKPNYISAMNYAFGPRYPISARRPLDYSRAKLRDLSEASLLEADGIVSRPRLLVPTRMGPGDSHKESTPTASP